MESHLRTQRGETHSEQEFFPFLQCFAERVARHKRSPAVQARLPHAHSDHREVLPHGIERAELGRCLKVVAEAARADGSASFETRRRAFLVDDRVLFPNPADADEGKSSMPALATVLTLYLDNKPPLGRKPGWKSARRCGFSSPVQKGQVAASGTTSVMTSGSKVEGAGVLKSSPRSIS